MKTKPWLCGSGQHVAGLITWNGNGVPQLGVFRHAIKPPRDMEDDQGEIMTFITGRATVDCDLCHSARLWDISVEVLVEIFRHLDAGQVFEFSKRLLEKS